MEDKIRSGEIDIGESIVERKYTKKVITRIIVIFLILLENLLLETNC